MNKRAVIIGTLQWCNERRKEKGMEPLSDLPKGRRDDGRSCPCGRACGIFVGYNDYFKHDPSFCEDPGNKLGRIPKCVSDFAYQFDAGLLPEYDERLS